jgi:predicted nucleic acid-binding protein
VAKYAIDTNIYIDSFRDSAKAADLKSFFYSHLAETFLSAVVVQELRAGARTPGTVATLQLEVFAPFERRGRVFTPSAAAFKECGRVLADLITKERIPYADTRRALVNDVLLAASCREHGIQLITNDSDFELIRRHIKGWRAPMPWPRE